MYSPHIAAMASPRQIQNQSMAGLWSFQCRRDFARAHACILLEIGLCGIPPHCVR